MAYRQPGTPGYYVADNTFASTEPIDNLIDNGYMLSPLQEAGLSPEQRNRYQSAYSNILQGNMNDRNTNINSAWEQAYGVGSNPTDTMFTDLGMQRQLHESRYDPRYPGKNINTGVDPNYIHEMGFMPKLITAGALGGMGAGLAGFLGPGSMAGTVGAGFGSGAAGAGTGAVAGIGTGAGAGVGAGAAETGSNWATLGNMKKAYTIVDTGRKLISGGEQNTGGSNMNNGTGSNAGLAALLGLGGGAALASSGGGNFLTGSPASANTASRSLMTPEQDATLSQLLARLNAGGNVTPYTGQLNAPKNNVQTGALQGMEGVMSNLDRNTQAYQGQLSPGNNNLQNVSLTALEQMALGNASNNAANQSSVKALTNFTNAGPVDINDYFNSSVQDPMLRDFQSKVLPQLTQRFSGQAGFGSDRMRQEQLVTNDMMNTLANSRTNMAFNAQNQANANKMQAAMALPGVTSAGINDMLNMQQGGNRQNAIDQTMLDNQYKDFLRQLSGNTQNANILTALQSGGNIGQAADQQPLTAQYQEFIRQQNGGQSNINNTLQALGVRPFENITTVQGQQNGLLQGLLAGLAQPGGMQGGANLLNSILGSMGSSGTAGDLGSAAMDIFAPELFNYSDMLGNGVSTAVPDLFSTLGGGNSFSGIPDIFGSIFN